MGDLDILSRKLSDRHLFEKAVKGVLEHTAVLIEVAIPPKRATVRRKLRKGVERSVVAGVEPESAAQREEINRKIGDLETFLTEVMDEPPRWIGVARVFVANPTGPQLREIAQSELVRAIRPNRRLR